METRTSVDKLYQEECIIYHIGSAYAEVLKLGPVVQSIVSLTISLRGQLVKCFTAI